MLTYGGKFLETTTSLATVVATFLNLVTQCCIGKWADTCTWTREAEDIGKELDTKKQEIRNVVLESKFTFLLLPNLRKILISYVLNDCGVSLISLLLINAV